MVEKTARGKAWLQMTALCCQKQEVRQNHDAEHDTVDAERDEGVLAHKAHEPFDGDKRHHEGHKAADAHDGELARAKRAAVQHDVLDELERARAEHHGDGQEEREFGGHRARAAEQQAADNGRPGARRAGDEREHLEATDAKRGLYGQVLHAGDGTEVRVICGVRGVGSRRRRKVRTRRAPARAISGMSRPDKAASTEKGKKIRGMAIPLTAPYWLTAFDFKVETFR